MTSTNLEDCDPLFRASVPDQLLDEEGGVARLHQIDQVVFQLLVERVSVESEICGHVIRERTRIFRFSSSCIEPMR